MQIYPQPVSCIKGSLRRAPGVEPDVIQSMGFDTGHDLFPFINPGGRVTGPGENGTLECASQESGPAVDGESLSFSLKLTHAKYNLFLMPAFR